MQSDDDSPPPDLSHAGAVIDKAIEYLMHQNIDPISIASALLGGSLGLLARSLDDAAIVRVLENAISSVQTGDLQRPNTQ
jgi:hypothetical protein